MDTKEFNLDDEFELNESDFTLLKPQICKVELLKNPDRSKRYQGGDKVPPCSIVEFNIKATTVIGEQTTIFHTIFWNENSKWKIVNLILGFSWGKSGEKASVPWSTAAGSTGFANIEIESYTAKDGTKKEKNIIKKFLIPGTEEHNKAKALFSSSNTPPHTPTEKEEYGSKFEDF